MSINLSALMKQRYDTAANWTAQNPTLLAGEIGIESDTKKWKVGTGATAWTSLVYAIGGTYPIVNADIAAAAAIAYSKLATLTSGNIVLGSAANVATSTAVTGDVTISNTGVTAIAAGVIVNADINASAAIVDTKLATIATAGKVSNSATTAASANTASAIVARDVSGNFTAGTITAALTGAASSNVLKAGDTMTGVLAVTAGTAALPGIAVSGDPNTGIYSPGADQVAISTNGTQRLLADSAGGVTVPTRFIIGQVNNVGGLSETTRITSGVFNTSRLLDGGTNPYLQTGAEAGIVYFNADGSSVPATVFRGGGTERLRITSTGALNFVGAGTAGSTQAVSFNGSAPVNSLVIDSSGRLGIGTSNPKIELQTGTSGGIQAANAFELAIRYNLYNSSGDKYIQAANKASSLVMNSDGDFVFYNTNTASTAADSAVTGLTARMAIKASGNVGIGVTSPSIPLQVLNAGTGNNTNNGAISLCRTSTVGSTLYHMYSTAVSDEAFAFSVHGGTTFSDTTYTKYLASAGGVHVWYGATTATERARIDSSGRLLVGTSSSRDTAIGGASLQVEGTSYGGSSMQMICNSAADASTCSHLAFGRSKTTSIGGTGQVANGDRLGAISWNGAQNSTLSSIAGLIECYVDGEVQTAGDTTDMPGRLVFSTTADGAASPVPQATITNVGMFYVGTTDGINPSVGNTGFFKVYGRSDPSSFFATGNSQTVSYFNRTATDGDLIEFRQDGTGEGTISVSGTTISYNGAHLSRWSQLSSGAERVEILRGSVFSNLDEMCEWGEEDNEQLNRMKVSDVEGDKNVSGVFQAWDDDDDTYTNDFYCAMTGDFVIRIADGITVERGDLLMSAGDGTAKPQDDDIIRSKTIAKVTSTNVSCTYEDGSYCVPCVLMAC